MTEPTQRTLDEMRQAVAELDALRAENERLREALGEAVEFVADVAHGPCAGTDNVKAWSVTMKAAEFSRKRWLTALGKQEAHDGS